MSQRGGDGAVRMAGMQFRKAISTVVLVALLTWSMSALCAPIPVMHSPAHDKMAYRTMVVEHPHMAGMPAHNPPQKMIVIVCYRMHGSGDRDSMSRCLPMPGDEAISGTAKYHDDGQARAYATAHAIPLKFDSPDPSGAPWERAGLRFERSVFESKADLRI
jgi:hypothetical protein